MSDIPALRPGYHPMRTGLLTGIPLSGRPLHPQFTFSYAALHPPMCYNMNVMTVWMKEVGKARQEIAEKAVEMGTKYLFFIDEDVTPPGHALRQLIYQADHHPEGMVFGGIYCHKSPPAMPMIFRGLGAGPYWDWKVGEFFEVDGISMGCTLIRTEVFEKLPKPWFKTVDDASAYWDGVPKAEMWTEDLYFCDLVRKAGYKVYADASVLAEHWSIETMTPTVLPPDCAPRRRAGWVKGEKKIVDLGCGNNKYETDEGDVLTVDIREDVNPDYRCDLGKLPFATGEFDIVYSSHVLEHFPRNAVPEILDEWIRVLKEDGEFRIIVPNIQWAAEKIMRDDVDNDVMNVLYGAQSFEENFHKFGFTPKVLEEMLKERGFKRIDVEMMGYNLCMRGWKIVPEDAPPSLGTPPNVKKNKVRGTRKRTKVKRNVLADATASFVRRHGK